MGIFGSSTKTYVSTSVSRVVDDKQIPESAKGALITAIIQGDDIGDSLMQSQIDSSVYGFERMYRYAKKGDYVYGLPNGRTVTEQNLQTSVKQVLEGSLGQPVTLDYVKLDEAIPKHFGYQEMYDNYGYDHVTGEMATLSAQKGTTVYFKNMMSYVPAESEETVDLSRVQLEEDILPPNYGSRVNARVDQTIYELLKNVQISKPVKDFVYDFAVDAVPRVEVFYMWEGNGITNVDSFIITVPDSTDADPKQFFQAGYTVSPTDKRFFTYEYGSGVIPELDSFGEVQYNQVGTYFPFAIFRRHFSNRTANTETAEFESTNRLLNYINIDFKEIGDSIHENPDIAEVAQCAMMMAVPLNTSNSIESRYLYEYFNRLREATTNTIPELYNRNDIIANNSITWADADYSMTLSYNAIKERKRTESIGAIGEYVITTSNHTLTYTTESGHNDNEQTHSVNYKNYHIKKQITESLCSEITLVNPVAKYDIDYKRSYESTQDNDILLIPLDSEITKDYKIKEKEELYHRSLHLVFNAKKVVKLKWYERSFFKFVMVVAAVAITVLSFGKLAPVSKAILALVALELYWLAIAALMIYISVVAVKIYAFRLIAKEIDSELLIIIAAIAISYSGYQYYQGNPMVGQAFSALSTNLIDASTYSMEQDMKAITREFEELSALKTREEKELEKSMELLETNDFLDPYAFIGQKPMMIMGETPDAFYNRTIHMGSTVDLSYKSIEHFVEASLRLPGID